jgi:hypothetical protein
MKNEMWIAVDRYSLKSGFPEGSRWPYLRNWSILGLCDVGWVELVKVLGNDILSDGELHEFEIPKSRVMMVKGIRLCQLGANRTGSRQLHIGGFILSGDVLVPPEIVEPITFPANMTEEEMSLAVAEAHGISPVVVSELEMSLAVFSEQAISPLSVPGLEISAAITEEWIIPEEADQGNLQSQGPVESEKSEATAVGSDGDKGNPASISRVVSVCNDGLLPKKQRQKVAILKDLTCYEPVGDQMWSRFGYTQKLRSMTSTGNYKMCIAKYYNLGSNCDSIDVFWDKVNRFVELSHPNVLPIVGLIPPERMTGQTNGNGPIVITEYHSIGSLKDVLDQVGNNNPPSFWNEAGKLRMILSLISGLQYLHNHGVVHRELKPSDLIVSEDGSIEIGDYLTGFFEDMSYTKSLQVGALSYAAPEIYEGGSVAQTKRGSATDVFSFTLILFEIIFEQKVFVVGMQTTDVMQKSTGLNRKQFQSGQRPDIPTTIHPILEELILRGWSQQVSDRPRFEEIWRKLHGVEFRVLENVEVQFFAP